MYKHAAQNSQSTESLEFTHFVVAKAEGVIFASARCNGKIENFLIDTEGAWVKQQVSSHFEYLPQEIGERISNQAKLCYGRIPIYRVNSFDFN